MEYSAGSEQHIVDYFKVTLKDLKGNLCIFL